MAIRSKCSPTQYRKGIVGPGLGLGQGCTVVLMLVTSESTDELRSWEWDETRDEQWAIDAVEWTKEHAESLGPGGHRYQLVARNADGVQKQSTWSLVHVTRERTTAGGSSDDALELDGSVESYVRMMQDAYAEERKARHESLKLVSDILAGQQRMMAAVLERTAALETKHTEHVLAAQANAPTTTEESTPPSGASDMFMAALAMMAPALGDKLGDKLGDALGPMLPDVLALVKNIGAITDKAAGLSAAAPAAAPMDALPDPGVES